MDDRWIQEQIDNWVSDFLIDDAGDRVAPALAPHAQAILVAFLRHACSIRQVTPDAIEEEDIRAGLLDGLRSLAIPDPVQDQVPQLVGDFLADLQRRGRLADGESHQHLVQALKEVQVDVPVVVRLAGTNVEEGQKILAKSGLPIIRATTLIEAAQRAVGAWQNDLSQGSNMRAVQ